MSSGFVYYNVFSGAIGTSPEKLGPYLVGKDSPGNAVPPATWPVICPQDNLKKSSA